MAFAWRWRVGCGLGASLPDGRAEEGLLACFQPFGQPARDVHRQLNLGRKLVEPSPVLLVKDGRLLARNLRQEFLTPEDLEAQMRQHDITSIAEVKRAYIESDGQFSFLTRSGGSKPAPPGRKRAGAA